MSAIALEEFKVAPPLRFATEEEFEAWCDEDTKAEYIDGEVVVIGPEPTAHGAACTSFGCLLELFTGCHEAGVVLTTGKTQVRLRSGLRRSSDIVFVKKVRTGIIREYFIDGAPDLVVEFVSPDSVIRDWHEKYVEYEAAGVREYWIIDRENQRLAVYHLDKDRRYQPIAPQDGKLHSRVLPGFWVKIDWFWQGPLFDTYEMVKEMGIIG